MQHFEAFWYRSVSLLPYNTVDQKIVRADRPNMNQPVAMFIASALPLLTLLASLLRYVLAQAIIKSSERFEPAVPIMESSMSGCNCPGPCEEFYAAVFAYPQYLFTARHVAPQGGQAGRISGCHTYESAADQGRLCEGARQVQRYPLLRTCSQGEPTRARIGHTRNAAEQVPCSRSNVANLNHGYGERQNVCYALNASKHSFGVSLRRLALARGHFYANDYTPFKEAIA